MQEAAEDARDVAIARLRLAELEQSAALQYVDFERLERRLRWRSALGPILAVAAIVAVIALVTWLNIRQTTQEAEALKPYIEQARYHGARERATSRATSPGSTPEAAK